MKWVAQKAWNRRNRDRMRLYLRGWRKRNPKRIGIYNARSYASRDPVLRAKYDRQYHLCVTYGLTPAEYEMQLEHQGRVCAICGRAPGRVSLNVDHDHKTGQLRGLLCFFCNRYVIGIGRVDADRHRRAAAYLDNPPWMEMRYVSKVKRRVRKRTGYADWDYHRGVL